MLSRRIPEEQGVPRMGLIKKPNEADSSASWPRLAFSVAFSFALLLLSFILSGFCMGGGLCELCTTARSSSAKRV